MFLLADKQDIEATKACCKMGFVVKAVKSTISGMRSQLIGRKVHISNADTMICSLRSDVVALTASMSHLREPIAVSALLMVYWVWLAASKKMPDLEQAFVASASCLSASRKKTAQPCYNKLLE